MQQLTSPYEETTRSASIYAVYEQMGTDRSLDKLRRLLASDPNYAKTGPKRVPDLKTLKVWSSKYSWVARAAQYDLHAIDRERKAQEHAEEARVKRKAAREAKLADARDTMDDERAPLMQAIWKKTLTKIDGKLKDGDTKGMMGLVSLIKHAMDEERQSRGVVATKQQIELTGKDGGPIQIEQWVTIRAAIFSALTPFPDARFAVAQALMQLDAPHDAGN